MSASKISYFHIPEHLDSDFQDEDWEIMKKHCLEYLLKESEIAGIRAFAQKLKSNFGQTDFTFTLKMYVLSKNRMFNMQAYMKRQSKLAEQFLAEQKQELNPETKRAALAKWIDVNANAFRKLSIFREIHCIDKMMPEIVPAVEAAVNRSEN